MSLYLSIIGIVLTILIVMTAIAEPLATLNYAKAVFKSGVKLWNWSVKVVKDLTHSLQKEKGNDMNVTKEVSEPKER